MRYFVKNATVSIILFSMIGFASAQDTVIQQSPADMTKNEENRLGSTVKSIDQNYLMKLYEENGSFGHNSFDYDYLMDEPINIEQVKDFSHPFLKKRMSDLTAEDKKRIIKSIADENSRQLRLNSILNVAMQYGVESALYFRGKEFQSFLNENEAALMQSFNYEMLMLGNGKIKPAVIDKVDYSLTNEDKRTQRKIKTQYKLVEQSELVHAAPSHVDFFVNLNFRKPKAPNKYLIPVESDEKKAWRRGVELGWVEGIQQADLIIQHNTRSLLRHYLGSIRFHILLKMNVVTEPTAIETTIGTTASGNVLNVGESVYELVNLTNFNDREMEWNALPLIDDIFDELSESTIEELTLEIIETF
jgi:defect-in-organelle-trafficking protein DotC